MPLSGNRLVEQIEQKFRRIPDCLGKKNKKKRVTVIVGLFYLTKTPTKNTCSLNNTFLLRIPQATKSLCPAISFRWKR